MFEGEHNELIKKTVLAGVFAAAGVLLSVVSVPMGPAKVFPFQHTINVLGGILLGPWWATGAAFVTSVVRNLMGTGSLFAFPGSMFGALFVGLLARVLPHRTRLCAALGEPLGTGVVGAWVASAIVAPHLGKSVGFLFFSGSFLMSCVPGALLGTALVWILGRRLARKSA